MNTLATSAVAEYARRVREAMNDLSPAQARSILDGLDDHLTEIAEDGAGDLEAVLGPPSTYAAELRAAAGLDTGRARPAATWAAPSGTPVPDPAGEPTPTPEDSMVGARRPAARIVGSGDLIQTGAGALLLFVFAILLFVLIRQTRPLNGFKVIFCSLVAGAMYRILRSAGRRAKLGAPLDTWLTKAIPIASVMIAVLIGGQLATPSVDHFQTPSAVTTIPGRPQGMGSVPNVVGLTLGDAANIMSQRGWEWAVEDLTGTGEEPGRTVIRMSPEAGTMLARGVMVTLTVGSRRTTVSSVAPSSSPSSSASAPAASAPTAAPPITSPATSTPTPNAVTSVAGPTTTPAAPLPTKATPATAATTSPPPTSSAS